MIKVVCPTTLLHIAIAVIPLVEGEYSPPDGITDMNTISSAARDTMLIDFLPLVHLVCTDVVSLLNIR